MATPKIPDDGLRGADLYRLDRAPETTRDRVQRLQQEARLLAREEVQALETKLAECIAMARSIGGGGDAYPAGVRELCDRMTAEIEGRMQTLTAIADRTFDT